MRKHISATRKDVNCDETAEGGKKEEKVVMLCIKSWNYYERLELGTG